MKYCPNCGADVEGLLHRCDLCFAILDPEYHFWGNAQYLLPQCLHFSQIVREILAAIEPPDVSKHAEYLNHAIFGLVCYTPGMCEHMGIKEHVRYYPSKKRADMTAIIDVREYMYATRKEKEKLIADAMHRSIIMLDARMKRYKRDISDIVLYAEEGLKKYRNQ